uniref:Uncharacterized protein n=1 Tax=Magallana gigas TaxID=29159 RepID=K1QEN9_MAGGI
MWLMVAIVSLTDTHTAGGITNGVGNQNAQPVLSNAEAIKVAETLVDTANQLLSILKRGSAVQRFVYTLFAISCLFERTCLSVGLDFSAPSAKSPEKDPLYGAPAALCPNGRPQAQCSPDPCLTWECANIAGVQCERTCDSCDPMFRTRGSDVTSICEIRRIPRPLHMMAAPFSPFDTFASEGLHPIERMFLRGTFPAK